MATCLSPRGDEETTLHYNPVLHNAYWIVALPFIAGALIVLLPFLTRLVPVFPEIDRNSRC